MEEEKPSTSSGSGLELAQQIKCNRKEELHFEIVEALAVQFQTDLDKDLQIRDELRGVSRDLEKATKAVVHVLKRIHLDAESDEKVVEIGEKAIDLLRKTVAPVVSASSSKMPTGEYFKYAEFVRTHIIRGVFAVGLATFLSDGSFATIDQVSDILNIPTAEKRQNDNVFLEWEEYLEGMIDVAQELARLAKNCVILDNFKLVGRIHTYISTLNYGFSGMNFKNDNLRRRYDSLKYDSRAIEEVVYDLKMQKGQ